jgi:hypothetical protein
MRLDSFGHEGPLPATVPDRLKLLPEIRGLGELPGDPAKDAGARTSASKRRSSRPSSRARVSCFT